MHGHDWSSDASTSSDESSIDTPMMCQNEARGRVLRMVKAQMQSTFTWEPGTNEFRVGFR